MTPTMTIKRYGIYNRQPCEFVLKRERHGQGYIYREYVIRMLTKEEIEKRANEGEGKQ